jgi:hypothetical protein
MRKSQRKYCHNPYLNPSVIDVDPNPTNLDNIRTKLESTTTRRAKMKTTVWLPNRDVKGRVKKNFV